MIRIFENEEYDDIQELDQEFKSDKTSINSSKLPAIFGMVDFQSGTINLDYGGGKFDNATKELAKSDVTNLIYDPYNRSSSHNKEVISIIRKAGGADTATCSNVLNVVKEENVRLNIIGNIYISYLSLMVLHILLYMKEIDLEKDLLLSQDIR